MRFQDFDIANRLIEKATKNNVLRKINFSSLSDHYQKFWLKKGISGQASEIIFCLKDYIQSLLSSHDGPKTQQEFRYKAEINKRYFPRFRGQKTTW